MFVISSKNFDRAVSKLPIKIKTSLKERLTLFINDPYADILGNHRLKGSLRHYRSIKITGDYRLIYEQFDENTVRLIDIGRHSTIYK